MTGLSFGRFFAIFLFIVVFGGVVLLLQFSPSILGDCEKSANPNTNPQYESQSEDADSIPKEEAEALRRENQKMSLELTQAKEELQHLESSLSAVNSELFKVKVRVEKTKELVPLLPNTTCAAPAMLQESGDNVYCADAYVQIGKAKDLTECQLACGFNSSCEFYSWWTEPGSRHHLCRITSSCDKLVPVEQKGEVVKIYKRNVPAASQQSYMQLMGMYDTGTNLMLATLTSNFPLCCHQVHRSDLSSLQVPAAPHGRCVRFATADKHTNPLQLFSVMQGNATKINPAFWDYYVRDKIVIVAMIRDPLSQLQSWKKAPYGMERCAKRRRCLTSSATSDCVPSNAWITEPCMWTVPEALFAGFVGGSFKSLPGIWNDYSRGYVRLQEESTYKDVLLVRFEELVTEPVAVVQRIASATQMDIQDAAIKTMEESAKQHGKARDRRTELRTLAARQFIKQYSFLELKAACIRLDVSLAKKVGYDLKECEQFKDIESPTAPALEAQEAEEAGKPVVPSLEERMAQFRSRLTVRTQKAPGKAPGKAPRIRTLRRQNT